MLFSSTIFLFYFLPFVLFCYYIPSTVKVKNRILLFFSLIFFAWAGINFTLILICSVIFNFFIGIWIERYRSKNVFIIGIVGNLALLVWFKYANFLVFNLDVVLGSFGCSFLYISKILLPIGISFYTFHSISYLIDVKNERSPAQKNIFDMALYIILFTQLVAGPIIRYNTFAPQLYGRLSNLHKFSKGIERFIIGLGKKVLIANTLARLAEESFHQDIHTMSTLLSWVGAISYTLQIYFDFSGYSDMAIGLSKMFGFDFPENFNLPYIAESVKDFWRRWHISLSSFFRDYLYFPLGGNKKGSKRTYFNLILVFFLTGLWHGANYTFIVWGIIHGFFLIVERAGFNKLLIKIPLFLRRVYTFIIVVLTWIVFRSDNITQALHYYRSLLPNGNDSKTELVASYFTMDFIVAMGVAILLAFNILNPIQAKLKRSEATFGITSTLNACFLLAVLFFSAVYLISGTYNPFIYYQF